MILRAKELQLVDGVEIGKDKVEITHLQFADDTVIFCPEKEIVIKNYRRLLDYFSLVLGLTINFSKLALIPLGCGDRWAVDISHFLKCKLQNLPLTYFEFR